MCQYLPIGNFIEIESTERYKDKILISVLDTKHDHNHGYFIESDLEYS